MKAYFERYPGIQDYMTRTKQFCREHGYVETLFRRRCHVPGIHDKNAPQAQFCRTRGDQRADPRHRRGRAEARHDPRTPGVGTGRAWTRKPACC